MNPPTTAAQYAPGPWLDVSDKPSARGDRMAMVSTRVGSKAIDCTGSGANFAQDLAHARLICAAPLLLESLAALMERNNSDNRQRAREAIAQALTP